MSVTSNCPAAVVPGLCEVLSTFFLWVGLASAGVADDKELVLEGAGGSVKFSGWNERVRGWSHVEYRGEHNSFDVYSWPDRKNTADEGRVLFSGPALLSPDGKILVIQRTDYSVVANEQGEDEYTELSHCEALRLSDGCVTYSGGIQECGGSWVGGKWKYARDSESDFSLLGLTPAKLVKGLNAIASPKQRNADVYDYAYMGMDSYVSCYPLSDTNVVDYNNLAFYMAGGGWHETAMLLYKRLLSFAPERVPLKLNVADSLWALGRTGEAQGYYRGYRQAMVRDGKPAQIPGRVNERLQ
ncbi:tetratricopeptide repeat protein [Pseudomonas xanthosomatis]|uniref:tetratricopeptide repeat protein n=1 Tax=Pseudomonas xanthosomatis TaxID=2842356 RepID=UPI003515AA6A